MSEFIISCCSTADLSAAHFAERNIHYIPFHFSLNDTTYPDDLGQSIPFPEFYQAMRDGAETKTSQVNKEEYVTFFTPFLEAGKDILHVSLSGGLSGSCSSAHMAQMELCEQYPDRKIYVVDSLAASSGFGLLMDTLCDKRDEGMDIDQLYHWLEENKLNMHHWFFSTDLTFYVKGGRISKTSGFFGTMLQICPLLNVSDEGKLVPREKVRTKKKVIFRIVEMMEKYARDGILYDGKCYISHSDCYEDARKVADLVEGTFRNLKGHVLINDIGTTIGSHTGPGTVALFFWGEERKD
ncbi:MAG: DegV family protein [Clostridia bacterium]|nr:DegV family protein [Clostridia bacterium]